MKLSDGQCVTACPPGTGDYEPINGACKPCASCATCRNQTACISCTGDNKLTLNAACLPACPDGTYNYTAGDNTCKQCPDNCKRCDTATSCTECNANYKLALDKTCVAVTCPEGSSDYNSSEPNVCKQCAVAHCAVCSSLTFCTTCKAGKVRMPTTGLCQDQCNRNTSTYGSPATDCLPCPSNCDSCSSSSNCTTCYTGFVRNLDSTCSVSCNSESSPYGNDTTIW